MINAKYILPAAIAITFCFAGGGFACSCGRIPTVDEELRSSEAVFVGKVVRVHDRFGPIQKSWLWLKSKFGESAEFDLRTYCSRFGFEVTFHIERSWKGPAGGEMKLLTGRGGGDCGIRFEEGGEYLVFASGLGKPVCNVGGCTRTGRADRAGADIAALTRAKRNKQPN